MAKLLGVEPPKREEPFKSEPLPRFDPTAAMGMPLETMREMARLDCGDPRADAAALNAGREMVEQDSKSDPSQQRAVGNGRGWVEPAPLSRELLPWPAFTESRMDRRDGVGFYRWGIYFCVRWHLNHCGSAPCT